MRWFKPASHGMRDEIRPGVPRLPPGAFWAVRACHPASRATGVTALVTTLQVA